MSNVYLQVAEHDTHYSTISQVLLIFPVLMPSTHNDAETLILYMLFYRHNQITWVIIYTVSYTCAVPAAKSPDVFFIFSSFFPSGFVAVAAPNSSVSSLHLCKNTFISPTSRSCCSLFTRDLWFNFTVWKDNKCVCYQSSAEGGETTSQTKQTRFIS